MKIQKSPLCLALLCTIALSTPSTASEPEVINPLFNSIGSVDPSTLTEENPSELQDQWYASKFNVSIEEAKKRQAAMDHAHSLSELLKEENENFVSMYINHEPNFKIVFNYVRGSNKNRSELNQFIKKSDLKKYLVIKHVKYSAENLKKIESYVLNRFQEFSVNNYEIRVDPKSNKIVVQVYHTDKNQAEESLREESNPPLLINGKEVDLSKDVIIEDLEELPEFISSWGGGLLLGYSSGWCTSGFAVRNSQGVLGLSSAEHCVPMTFWNSVTSSNRLTPIAGIASRDVAWFRTPSNLTPTNRIEYSQNSNGTPTSFINIVGVRSTNVGTSVCKYGKTTSRTCGVVVATGHTVNVGGSIVSNLVRVTRNGQYNGGSITHTGDSGGPWFIGGSAVGTSVAGDLSSPASYFAPVSSITAMGVSILTN